MAHDASPWQRTDNKTNSPSWHRSQRACVALVGTLNLLAAMECTAATLLQVVVDGQEQTITDSQYNFEPSVRFETRDALDRWFGGDPECSDCVANEVTFDISSSVFLGPHWQLSLGAGESPQSGLVDLDVGAYDAASNRPFCTLVFGNNQCGQLLKLTRDSHEVVPSASDLLPGSFGAFPLLPTVGFLGIPGSFEVLEAQYGPDGELLRFAADFQQFARSFPGGELRPVLAGKIRYNSTVPIPEPTSSALILLGAVLSITTPRVFGSGAHRRSPLKS